MSKTTFTDDPVSRTMIRSFLLLQLAAMVIVVWLSLTDLFFLALAISFLTLLVFILSILGLYFRYRNFPFVREKRKLERLVHKFQKSNHRDDKTIKAAIAERVRLVQLERDEINAELRALQKIHIAKGLAHAYIRTTSIPGVGPKLKDRLAGYGIMNAAQITEKISELHGFGEAKRVALISWRQSVIASLESTKPGSLPREQLEAIRGKYQTLHDQNNAAEREAYTSKRLLNSELISFQLKLQNLTRFTFVNYLNNSMAAHRHLAGPVAYVLIFTQVISSVSATASSIIASISDATPDAQTAAVLIPITGPTNLKSSLSMELTSPTPSGMPSRTQSPTWTPTSSPTETSQTTTVTSTPRPTFTSQPSNTADILVNGSENNNACDPSYPGVCIPPRPPDLDCPQISYTNFTVLPPDPHGFDRDGDGIGCEG
jgi:hypothetical protein